MAKPSPTHAPVWVAAKLETRESLVDILEGSAERILAIRITSLFPGSGFLSRSLWIPLSLTALVVSSLATSSLDILACRSTPSILLALAVTFEIYLLQVFPHAAWLPLVRSAEKIADLLHTEENTLIAIEWLERHLSHKSQQTTARIGALFGLATATAIVPLVDAADLCISTLLTGAIAGYFGVNSIYWLIFAARSMKVAATLEGLNLRPQSPATTDAAIQLAKLEGAGALMASFGAIFGIVPLVLFHRQTGSTTFTLPLFFGSLVVGLSVSMINIFLPIYYTWSMIRRKRNETLSHLQRQIDSGQWEGDDLERLLSWYNRTEQSPNYPISLTPIVQYTAAILGAFVPFIAVLLLT